MLDQVIAWAALLFSGIALITALRVQRRQPELIARQIAELDRAGRDRKGSRVTASLNTTAAWFGNAPNVRITNHGPAEARDVDLQFPNGNSPIPREESREKLPIAVLQPDGSVNLIASISHDVAPPFHALLSWRDGLGEHRQEATLG